MSLALLFPGQGSQHVGMGLDLAGTEPIAAETLREADDILGFGLSALMAEGPESELTATKNAQPAILAHSVAVLRVARDRTEPMAMLAGHSLGEYSAYVAAGTLTFEDALLAVRLRGELMYEAGEARPGAMAAVLGLPDEVIVEACSKVDEGTCEPANFNAPGQVVISGDVGGVERGMALLKEAGAKRVIPLKVSGAFHSPLMRPAATGLREHLATVTFEDPMVPVVSNVTAETVDRASDARELLVEQLTAPVRWSASVQTMIRKGIDRFLELGPGNVLCTLNRRNAQGLPCAALGRAEDLRAAEPGGVP